MSIAVVTPYYREGLKDLLSAHHSVLQQDVQTRHIMVADGYPKHLVNLWTCEHIILPSAHRDAGNFARGVGALHAFQTGASHVCFLDADNWLESHHVSSLSEQMSASGAEIGVCLRMLRRLDRSILDPFDWESDGARFADTGTIILSRAAIEIAALWATIPVELSGAGDRIVWAAINERGFTIARTELATMNYKTKWAVHYTGRGETAPDGTVGLDYVHASADHWKALALADKRRLLHGRA